jgi:hypothetical protein
LDRSLRIPYGGRDDLGQIFGQQPSTVKLADFPLKNREDKIDLIRTPYPTHTCTSYRLLPDIEMASKLSWDVKSLRDRISSQRQDPTRPTKSLTELEKRDLARLVELEKELAVVSRRVHACMQQHPSGQVVAPSLDKFKITFDVQTNQMKLLEVYIKGSKLLGSLELFAGQHASLVLDAADAPRIGLLFSKSKFLGFGPTCMRFSQSEPIQLHGIKNSLRAFTLEKRSSSGGLGSN